MSNLWDECENIRKEVNREFTNLQKSKGRPRSLSGILEKTQRLQELANKFEANAQKVQHRANINDWNELTDSLFVVQFQVKEAVKILNETPIIQGNNKARGSLQTLRSLRTQRRASESGNTLKVPSLGHEKKSHSAEDLTMPGEDRYQFPMVTAIQCIPEFHGKPEELRPFTIQVDYFAKGFPENANHEPLLNVVYTKLRGDALIRLQEIQETTWAKVKENLEKAFHLEKSIGSIIKEIETLVQAEHEPFEDYKNRGRKLYRYISALPEHGNESYAGAALRRHFLGGLRNRALALAGKSQRDKLFPDLLDWLQREYEEEEELMDIHQRLLLHPNERLGNNSNYRNYNHNPNNSNYRENRNTTYGNKHNNYRGNNFRNTGNYNYDSRRNHYNQTRNNHRDTQGGSPREYRHEQETRHGREFSPSSNNNNRRNDSKN